MSETARVHPELASELARFGGASVGRCFNCGNCTAACSLVERDEAFPRRLIRYAQLGLVDKLESAVEPWLCYYCGDCGDTCPREAHPGELMMTMRRWLTSRYDFTGLSRRLYVSHAWEFGALLAVALLVIGLFTLPENFGFGLLAQHPEARETVMLEYFAPLQVVHYSDWALAALLSVFLVVGAARMARRVMHDMPLPVSAYLGQLAELVIHGLTQKRWRECDVGAQRHWRRHLLLVTAYATMLLLVVGLLPTFQVQSGGLSFESWNWTSLLGYYATAVLLGATLTMGLDRLKKKDAIHRFSHATDWLYIVLLFLTALSGILLHLFRLMDLAMATYVLYVAHLAIAVPMLVVEVPFGKWPHLVYRPLAAYLDAVRRTARARELTPVTAH